MPTAWTQLYVHLVFSTKLRAPYIADRLETRLHKFLGGIARDMGCAVVAIGGMPDHVHVLVRIKPDVAVSDLVRHLKGRSAKWANESVSPLYWQEGYGAFSVSSSLLDEVTRYIETQKEHHSRLTFQEEFELFLRKHGIPFRPEDVWQPEP